MNIKSITQIDPFLRWAGGKSWLKKYIKNILTLEDIPNYHEPFLGGGSIFLYLKSTNHIKGRSFLSDKNSDLINTYKVVKDKPEELIKRLNFYKNTKEFYYEERATIYTNEIHKAAQFIYLNRTSYNGIYRVNQKGIYNVPYGFKSYKSLFDFENLIKFSKVLQRTNLDDCDFDETISKVRKGDFVFLDPPYTVAHGRNGFNKYNQKLFAWEDQIRLKKYIEKIIEKKAYFILTNAEHESINELFSDIGEKHVFPRANLIGGKKAERNIINEYVFTNL